MWLLVCLIVVVVFFFGFDFVKVDEDCVGFVVDKLDLGLFVEMEYGFMVFYLVIILGMDVIFEMVFVLGGFFVMGSLEGEEGYFCFELL